MDFDGPPCPQCDERRPICSNCARRDVACSFTSQNLDHPEYSSPEASSSASTPAHLVPKDYALFHHFCFVTAPSFGAARPVQDFWSLTVPRLAFKHPFLLHAIISLGALHQAHMQALRARDEPSELTERAAAHWAAALRLASPLLLHVDKSNCAALYLFTTLTCVHAFALGPRPGDMLILNRNGPADWLALFRGLRSIEQACRPAAEDDEELRSIYSLSLVDLSAATRELDPPMHEVFSALEDVIRLDAAADRERQEVLLEAYGLLRACYAVVYAQPSRSLAYLVFSWLHRASSQYVELAQVKDCAALVLFSYFVVLLKRLEGAWMLAGWPAHLISEIYECIPPGKRSWIRWPMDRVGWLPQNG